MKTETEWTPEHVGSLVGGTFNGAWAIADAHNAAIKEAQKPLVDALTTAIDLIKELDQYLSDSQLDRYHSMKDALAKAK